MDNDEVVSTWSVCIAKYGNEHIVARKSERNEWLKVYVKQDHDDSVFRDHAIGCWEVGHMTNFHK